MLGAEKKIDNHLAIRIPMYGICRDNSIEFRDSTILSIWWQNLKTPNVSFAKGPANVRMCKIRFGRLAYSSTERYIYAQRKHIFLQRKRTSDTWRR